jgi:hypothetical protein
MAFQDPQNRNKRGQIRAKPIRDALDGLLSRDADDALLDKPKTMAQRIALSLLKDALDGDKDARSELIDRTDGKAIQAVEHSGFIARTHEEELVALDNPESDDATGEGTSPPSP